MPITFNAHRLICGLESFSFKFRPYFVKLIINWWDNLPRVSVLTNLDIITYQSCNYLLIESEMFEERLTLTALQTKTVFFSANSVDPDETAHKEPSHQNLHCLQFSVY